MAPIKLSIIIPTYNEEEDIGECLKSLEDQDPIDMEIIIVDDGSTDRTREIAQSFKNIKLISGEHKGPGFSRNLGAKEATGDILIFVDADMTFEKAYLKNLISPLIEDKQQKVIGSTHDYEEAKNIDNMLSDLWGKIRITTKDKNPKVYAGDVKIFRAIWKNKFFELGGFDSKYGYADDQTFWFKHSIKPTLANNTICYHKNPETLSETFKQARWIGASWKERYWFFKTPIIKYFAVIALFLLLPFIVLLKTINQKRNSKYSFYDLITFYLYKFTGFSVGVFRAVYLGTIWK